MKKMLKYVGPGADKILPVELGGKNGTLEEIRGEAAFSHPHLFLFRTFSLSFSAKNLDLIKATIQRERQLIANLQVEEASRQPMTMNYLMSYDSKSMDNSMGVSGTYTKFDV